jgi:hypothetical protein
MTALETPVASEALLSTCIDDGLAHVIAGIESGMRIHRSDDSLRSRVRLLCVFARQEELPVEKLLVRLRNEFIRSPELRRLPIHARDDAERETVRFLISAYYSDRQ